MRLRRFLPSASTLLLALLISLVSTPAFADPAASGATGASGALGAFGTAAGTTAANELFFVAIQKYISHQILGDLVEATGRMFVFIGAIGIAIVTLWITFQGWRIMTGQSRNSMMELFERMLKAVFILGFVSFSGAVAYTGSGSNGDHLNPISQLVNTFSETISRIVLNEEGDVFKKADENLNLMRLSIVMINGINAIPSGSNDAASTELQDKKNKAMMISTFGQSSPAMVGGTLVLLNQIALHIGLMLGPLFVLLLLFEQTKQFFWKWVNQMVGLLFTMCILVLVTSVCLKVSLIFMAATGVAKLSSYFSGSFGSAGSAASSIMGVAVQQGGLGLLLSTLLLAVPPMVMNFFNATLGGGIAQGWFGGGSTGANNNTNNNNNNNNNGTGNKGTIGARQDEQESTKPPTETAQMNQRAANAPTPVVATGPNTTASTNELSKGAYGNAPKTPNKEG